jgi:membrane-associated protein
VTFVQRLAAALAETVARTGAYAPAILFFATLVEYVFPPFPGDLLVVLGAWYSVHGSVAWPITFVSVTAGAMAGAWVDYRLGQALGRRLDRRAATHDARLAVRLARFEASYRRWGAWLLVGNRFMPGLRAFVFLAAGAAQIPLRRVMLLGGLSAALWNVFLLGAGALLARNVEELVAVVDRYTRAAWAVLAVLALLVGAVWFWRRREAARARSGAPERR